jgi:hypothetical protein
MDGALVKIGLMLGVCAMAWAPVCAADPADSAADPVPVPAESSSTPTAFTVPIQQDSPVADACKQFNAALNVAAANYEDFAYATAGNGNYVDYQDQNVWRTNVVGRTALRQSAAAALSASATPGLPSEVSNPMRSWSLGATKLLLVMGLHGGGDTLNNSVADLNTDANNAQMACALVGRGGS